MTARHIKALETVRGEEIATFDVYTKQFAEILSLVRSLASGDSVMVTRKEIEMLELETRVIAPNLPMASQGRAFTVDAGKAFRRWLAASPTGERT